MKKAIPVTLALFILSGCEDENIPPLSEQNAIKLMEDKIADRCIYQTINSTFNVALNTIKMSGDSPAGNLVNDKDRNIISIKEGDERLLNQAQALESVGFVKKIADYIIIDPSTGVYYDRLSPVKHKETGVLSKLKGHQFKLTTKSDTMIRKWYDADGTMDVCIAKMKIDKIKMTVLDDDRTRVLAEMTHDDLLDWARDEKVLNAFGDFTDVLYENALIGLKEAYFIKGTNGYVVENNKINTIR